MSSSFGAIEAMVGECYRDGSIVVLINEALASSKELVKSEVCTAGCNAGSAT
jgi:hypothetical protein